MSKHRLSDKKNAEHLELGTEFLPQFNEDGLIPCIAVDSGTRDILMFAWMNEESLHQTLITKKATFYSRSRNKLWVKGESSGRTLNVKRVLIDCDQDVIQVIVDVAGEGVCHRGYRTCFYREVVINNPAILTFVEDKPVFDPKKVYDKL